MPGRPEHVGQDYLPELPKLIGILTHTTAVSDFIRSTSAFLPRCSGCDALSHLRGCDPPEAFIRYSLHPLP